MIFVTITLVLVLVAILGGACWTIFALLRRLDEANSITLSMATQNLTTAREVSAQSPRQFEAMLHTLTGAIAQVHSSVDSTLKTLLIPMQPSTLDPPSGPMYNLPVMDDGSDEGKWDHTDGLMPRPDGARGYVDAGYEHETDEDFDPDNPFGIPGMKSVVP
jgi:hypothetical protein